MTFEEQINALKERHEALTQSVEILVLEGKKVDERIDKLTTIMDGTLRIVAGHESRLHRLEGGDPRPS